MKKKTISLSINPIVYEKWRFKYPQIVLSRKLERLLRSELEGED